VLLEALVEGILVVWADLVGPQLMHHRLDVSVAGRTLSFDVEGDYRRDGAVCVRRAFGPGDMARAAEAIEDNLASLSPLAKRASGADDGAFIEDFCSWRRLPAMKRFITSSPAAAIAGALTGSTQIRLYHDHVLVKEPGTRQRTPWHQDQPYYNVDGRQNASMWLPVDPVDAETTLQLVAGSHRGPWYLPRTFLDDEAKWFPEGTLAELPDIAEDPVRWPILGWALEPGDAVFFDMATLHAAGGVAGPNRRRVLSVRFLGDDMTHAPRPWTTSPPFPGLEAQLPAGAAMDHPLFPVLWSRPRR
jgi:ectoine hydroxylase-related dioxygenase (phytanoyl-CoA dioxygenase family)